MEEDQGVEEQKSPMALQELKKDLRLNLCGWQGGEEGKTVEHPAPQGGRHRAETLKDAWSDLSALHGPAN